MAKNVVVPAARPVFTVADRKEIADLIDSSLTTGSLTLGPTTETFEREFADRHGGGSAIAVSSGTAALEIIFRALGVEGRKVIVPTNTFFATAAAVAHAGGTPVLADVDATTLTLSADTVRAVLDDDTSGVVLVHIGGAVSPASAAIAELCRERGIWFVEDAAHAHGAALGDTPAGSFGVAAAFSFYPTKVMTSGEGGMIVTRDEKIDQEARVYRDQGKAGFLGGDHVRLGYAWRMSEVHAAIGLVQLRRLDEYLEVRRHVGARYDEALASIDGLTPLARPADSAPNFYKYIALLDPGIDRAAFKQAMRDDHGVAMSGEVYASPLHLQPVFADLATDGLGVAEDVCARHVCLPVHSDMTDAEIDLVVDAARAVAGQLRVTS
ncbi:MAG: perosamine synthetase [Actinomycetota bacterium]|nr:perosamine synthetase [Actinomycetota bacterium]